MPQSPEFFKKISDLSMSLKDSVIEQKIRDLVNIRASQMNGCASASTCMSRKPRSTASANCASTTSPSGGNPTCSLPRERAALAWTEALTKLPEGGVPDELYERVRGQLSEKEISDLTFSIITINAWNRISIAFKAVPGSADKLYGLDKAGLN
jgi:alkylhydroperoxidase family enzyme